MIDVIAKETLSAKGDFSVPVGKQGALHLFYTTFQTVCCCFTWSLFLAERDDKNTSLTHLQYTL